MDLLPALCDFPGLSLFVENDELVAHFGRTVEANNQRRLRGAYFVYTVVALVKHGANTPAVDTRDERVTDPERAILYQYGCHVSTSLFETAFDDDTRCLPLEIASQLEQIGLEEHLIQKVTYSFTRLGRDKARLDLSAILLDEHVVVGELLHNPLRIGFGLIDLVDRDHNRHVGGLCVIYGLNGLRHHGVVSGNH